MSIDSIEEIIALWTAVYGEPPSISTDVGLMLQALVEHLPEPTAVAAPEASDVVLQTTGSV